MGYKIDAPMWVFQMHRFIRNYTNEAELCLEGSGASYHDLGYGARSLSSVVLYEFLKALHLRHVPAPAQRPAAKHPPIGPLYELGFLCFALSAPASPPHSEMFCEARHGCMPFTGASESHRIATHVGG